MAPLVQFFLASSILLVFTPLVSAQGAGACPTNVVSYPILAGSVMGAFIFAIILETTAILCYKHYFKKRPPKLEHTFITSDGQEVKIKEKITVPDGEKKRDRHEDTRKGLKSERKQEVFSVSDNKTDSEGNIHGPAIYRFPIATDKETGDSIMNGRHNNEQDLGNNYLYSTGYQSSEDGSGFHSRRVSHLGKDEVPILRGLHKGSDVDVDFSSARFKKSMVRQPMPQEWTIGMGTTEDDVMTYRYHTGLGGKRRASSPTLGIENQGFVSSRPGSPTGGSTVVQMEPRHFSKEARINIDDGFLQRSARGGTSRGTIDSNRPGLGRAFDSNFTLRDPQRSDSSDEDLYDYGDSEHSGQSSAHFAPGRYRADMGGIPLYRTEGGSPTSPRSFRFHTGFTQAQALAMQGSGDPQARGEPVYAIPHKTVGSSKMVRPHSVERDTHLGHTTYSVINEAHSTSYKKRQDPNNPNQVVRDSATQCELLAPRPKISFDEEWPIMTSGRQSRANPGVPTIGKSTPYSMHHQKLVTS